MAEHHPRTETTMASSSSKVVRYSRGERSGKAERDRFTMRKSGAVISSNKVSKSARFKANVNLVTVAPASANAAPSPA